MAEPYECLQVHPLADPEIIRAAYRVLARRYHPDAGGDPKRMSEINEAWAILGDDVHRAIYDAERSHQVPRASRPPATPAPPKADSDQSARLLDFGRYAGWSIGQLGRHDPIYLEWLVRTPIGRSYRREIDDALGTHVPVSGTPTATVKRHRRWGRG